MATMAARALIIFGAFFLRHTGLALSTTGISLARGAREIVARIAAGAVIDGRSLSVSHAGLTFASGTSGAACDLTNRRHLLRAATGALAAATNWCKGGLTAVTLLAHFPERMALTMNCLWTNGLPNASVHAVCSHTIGLLGGTQSLGLESLPGRTRAHGTLLGVVVHEGAIAPVPMVASSSIDITAFEPHTVGTDGRGHVIIMVSRPTAVDPMLALAVTANHHFATMARLAMRMSLSQVLGDTALALLRIASKGHALAIVQVVTSIAGQAVIR